MEKELITLVKTKSYHQLTSVELEQLSEWCSTEEEFLQLKYLFTGLENSNSEQINEKVSDSVKESLDQIFQEQHHNRKHSDKQFYLFLKRSYIQLAALVLLIVLCYPLFHKSDKGQASSQKQIAVLTNKNRKKLLRENKHENGVTGKDNCVLDEFPELVFETNKPETQIAQAELQSLDSAGITRSDFSIHLKTPVAYDIPSSESIVSAVKIVPAENSNGQKVQETTFSSVLLDVLTPCF